MELLVLNQKNATSIRMGKATIRVNRGVGTISFSKSACKRMGLTQNSKLAFCQDKKNPSDWYIRTDDPDGFQPRKVGGSAMMINSKRVVVSMLDTLHIKQKCSFMIGAAPIEEGGVKYWAIITSNRIGEV